SDVIFAPTVKKRMSYLHARPGVRYQFIEEHRKEYPVALLCETLEVSVSGYYDWRKRPMSEHAASDARLADQIQAAYRTHQGRYGSPRLFVELHEQGIRCSEPPGRAADARVGSSGSTGSPPHPNHSLR